MKKLSNILAYAILRIFCFLFAILPLSFVYLFATGLGNFAFHVFGYRRSVTMANLQIAFGPEMTEKELTTLAAKTYQQIAMSFMELLIAPKLHKNIQQIMEPEQIEVIQRLLAKGKGLITVSGHLGNWELQGAAAATALSEPFTVAATQQSNPYIDRFITRRRNQMGMEVAGSKAAMKILVKALKDHKAIGLVADQNAGQDAVFVDFFNKAAATHPGPAQMALKYDAPMIVGAAIRTGPGRFKVLHKEVEILADDTVESLTQRHVKILEDFIRQHPDQYFWLHRRWKTRPPDEKLGNKGAKS
jgi:KDO2-lipid IV(A) lauroyltransferase